MQMSKLDLCSEKLISLRSELLNTSVFRTDSENIRTSRGDEADQAASEINLNLTLRLQERDRFLVQKIDYALAKIKEGDFGECEGCGADIEEKRLKARPYATLCIACKEEQEHRKRFFA